MAEEMNNTAMQQNPVPNKNMTVCKACGAQIAKGAKACPACGAKNKKPIFKRVWFWAIIVVVLLGIVIGTSGGDSDNGTAEKPKTSASAKGDSPSAATVKEYTQVGIDALLSDLKENAYNAKQTWDDQYVEITGGYVATIDASGAYFSIESKNDAYWLDTIRVDIPYDIRDSVMSQIGSDKSVTIKGKIADVGEVIGYSVDAQEVIIR